MNVRELFTKPSAKELVARRMAEIAAETARRRVEAAENKARLDRERAERAQSDEALRRAQADAAAAAIRAAQLARPTMPPEPSPEEKQQRREETQRLLSDQAQRVNQHASRARRRAERNQKIADAHKFVEVLREHFDRLRRQVIGELDEGRSEEDLHRRFRVVPPECLMITDNYKSIFHGCAFAKGSTSFGRDYEIVRAAAYVLAWRIDHDPIFKGLPNPPFSPTED